MRIAFVLLSLTVAIPSQARELSCIPRSEMGETVAGQHLYERDKDLQIKNLSRINLDTLTITSAEGKISKIIEVESNIYRSSDSGAPYYFVTNDSRTIVTELSVQEPAVYIKVLLCK